MSPIKLVGFDLDDCLFDSTGLSRKARIKGIEAMIELGLYVDQEKAVETIQEIVDEYGSNFPNHYDYFIRRLKHLNYRLNLSYSDRNKYIAAAVKAYHQEKVNSIKLYDDVEDCLKKLKELSIKTMVITDGLPIKQYDKILRLGLDKLIDMVIISDEIGIRKPNPDLFEYSLKEAGISGTEAIYIGDRIDKDIVPAKLNNIVSIYIHRGGKHDIKEKINELSEMNKPDYEISTLMEIFAIIDVINKN
jgi:putative hydrolase of the HAD superfamily